MTKEHATSGMGAPMSDYTIYAVKHVRDHIDRLIEIADLAKVGAASTDTNLNVEGLERAHCSLFSLIHQLASEGIDFAEVAAQRKS